MTIKWIEKDEKGDIYMNTVTVQLEGLNIKMPRWEAKTLFKKIEDVMIRTSYKATKTLGRKIVKPFGFTMNDMLNMRTLAEENTQILTAMGVPKEVCWMIWRVNQIIPTL